MKIKYSNFLLSFFAIVFYLLPCSLNAQQIGINVLKKRLLGSKEDTNKIIILNKLCSKLTESASYSEADSLALAAIHLSNKLNYKKGLADALNNIGDIYFYQDDYLKSMDFYLKSQKLSDSIGSILGIASSINGIGEIYEYQDDPNKALELEFKSLELAKKVNDKECIGSASDDIGRIYENSGDTAKAIEYVLISLKAFQDIKDTFDILRPLIDIGDIFLRKGEYAKALNYLTEGLDIEKKIGNEDYRSSTLLEIAELFEKRKNYKIALSYADTSLQLAENINSVDDIKETQKVLSELYESIGDYYKAFIHQKVYNHLRDSINGPKSTRQVVSEALNYEFTVKQALEKIQQDKKDAIEQAAEKRKNTIITGAGVIIILVLIFTLLLLNRFKVTQRQKTIIADKNKEITDSINYAKRIQVAMLPDTLTINDSIKENFILFKPKDIVSGDFYFFAKVNSTLFIAAADCTGHGVPGGFMSMICSEKLHDAIAQSQETSTILQFVNKGIKLALHQSEAESSTHDGMDIALCAIEGKTISYAGANRPLWIIKKDGKEIEEIKATKQAIGGFTPTEHIFESHQISLNTGDTFYIFSDGYADQFGGEKAKKLTTKKFKEKLLSIQNMSMEKQQKELDSYIELWKGDREQIDDILVIGVRI